CARGEGLRRDFFDYW
nr:immunoglobulin heavy chain junction region [Mus musculus]